LEGWLLIPLVIAGALIVSVVAIPIPGLGKQYDTGLPTMTLAQSFYFRFAPPPHSINDKVLVEFVEIRMKPTDESMSAAVNNLEIVKEFIKRFPDAQVQKKAIDPRNFRMTEFSYNDDLKMKEFSYSYDYNIPSHADKTIILKITIDEYKHILDSGLECGGATSSTIPTPTVEDVRSYCPNLYLHPNIVPFPFPDISQP
jgi:hypothetical protein